MSVAHSVLGRADLLRVLALTLEDEHWRAQLALALGFVEQESQRNNIVHLGVANISIRFDVTATATVYTALARPSLQTPFWGLTKVKVMHQAAAKREEAALAPLKPDDYLASATWDVAPLQRLIPRATLARRLQTQLASPVTGRKIDVKRAVDLAARAQTPSTWPMRVWPQAPAQIHILADRSLYLRPYWRDQEQIVYALTDWVGQTNVSIYTLNGDPWRISTSMRRGRERDGLQQLPKLSEEDVVMVLSDRGTLARREGKVGCGLLWSRWQLAYQRWLQQGARVITCPPAPTPPIVGEQSSTTFNAVSLSTLHQYQCPSSQQDGLELLLSLLSFARCIEAELLRAMRLIDPRLAGDPSLEAAIWSCEEHFHIANLVCVWKVDSALRYRHQFAQLDPTLQQSALAVLFAQHANLGPALVNQEILAWASRVAPSTRSKYAREIEDAEVWLRRLLTHPPRVNGEFNSELIRFAQESHAIQGFDAAFVETYADILAPLWAIAESRIPAGTSLDGGVIPLAQLLVARRDVQKRAPVPTRRYHLQQRGMYCVLAPEVAEDVRAASPFGMPLELGEFAFGTQAPHVSTRILNANSAVIPLTLLQHGQIYQLRTPDLELTIAEITPPFPCIEQGMDKYGMYADIKICGVIQRMRYIAPGQFLMGSPEVELSRSKNEGPQHQVTITEGFWMADTACTLALWQAVMDTSHIPWWNSSEYPVSKVSWFHVQEFLTKVNTDLSQCYTTLPLEAEWEYACRAGTSSPFSFGETISVDSVNYDGNYPYSNAKGQRIRTGTVAVQSLPANSWGLFQMHGNVWEWCADGLQAYLGFSREIAWKDSTQEVVGLTSRRVVRGGSWYNGAQFARSAFRYDWHAADRDDVLGFRFVIRPLNDIE